MTRNISYFPLSNVCREERIDAAVVRANRAPRFVNARERVALHLLYARGFGVSKGETILSLSFVYEIRGNKH